MPQPQEWPMTFPLASSALRFADGYLRKPKQQSQLAVIRRQHQRQPARASQYTQVDYEDLATQISVELEQVSAPERLIYRHVYGYLSTVLDVAQRAADLAWSGPGTGRAARKKTIAQCRSLALLALEDVRRRRRFGVKLPQTRIAAEMRLRNRQQLYEQWSNERDSIYSTYHQWLAHADRELTERLSELGIVRGYPRCEETSDQATTIPRGQ